MLATSSCWITKVKQFRVWFDVQVIYRLKSHIAIQKLAISLHILTSPVSVAGFKELMIAFLNKFQIFHCIYRGMYLSRFYRYCHLHNTIFPLTVS